jgi:hypothetical protein
MTHLLDHRTAAKETPMTTNDSIPAEELGIWALPPDATPAQRAHAEAVWRPAAADQPCRCSGTDCEHGRPCWEYGDCDGRYVHADRYLGSMLELTAWWDEYACDTCGDGYGRSVSLLEIPWGEHVSVDGRQTTRVYPGVRHPSFPDDPDAEDEVPACQECLVDRHRLCPYADVGDHWGDPDDPDYELVERYCCCGSEWIERQLATGAEYAAYAREVTELYGYDHNHGPGEV